MALGTLDDLSLLHIASLLNDKDLLALSSMNRRLFHLLSNEQKIWKRLLIQHDMTISAAIETAAFNSSLTGCYQKKLYLLCRKVQNNIQTGKCTKLALPPSSATLYPWVGHDRVFWLDWPERFVEFFNASILPTLILQEWDGTTKMFRTRTFQVPETLSRFSKLKLLVNLEQSVVVLVVDQPHGIMHSILDDISGNSTRRKLIALDIGSQDLRVLWSHSFGVVKDRVFMSGAKICSVSRTRIQFLNVRTGEQTSMDISRQRFFLKLTLHWGSEYKTSE